MRRDSHIPCSERTGTKQELAIKHDKEAEGTLQGLAFGPNDQEALENHQKQLTKRSSQVSVHKNQEFNTILES